MHRSGLAAGGARGRARGFTLTELMIALAVLGVLAAVGVPAMRDMIVGGRIRSAASDLYESMLIARSEAIKRNTEVRVVPASSGWAGGWTVQIASTSTVLQSRDAISGITISATASGSVCYKLDGRLSLTSPCTTSVPRITSYSTEYPSLAARCVMLDASGRPSIRTDNDADPTNGCV
jgi:type IV fimbrial biogenesis protein FimT